VPSRAPTLGEHTDEVLTEALGLSADQLATLKESGALG
jgi:crotonobetainyl-CoA:carnitine CoA-transferase CaiB-like acyl-CoA transferase